MTREQVIAAIVANHLKANIDHFERNPIRWGRPMWAQAWLDGGGPVWYLHVPIKGGEWDGTQQRVYPPARLMRRIAKRYGANQ